jgi:hypothetical protein
MEGYLGETQIDVSAHEKYGAYTKEDWVLFWVEYYGQFDGGHHKQWTMDQIVRILKGTEVIIKEASWDNGHTELRFNLGDPTQEYHAWVEDMKGEPDEEGDYEYSYDEGCPP